MESLIIVIHILSAVAIIGLVLIQQGKGADMGASFGSGASQTIFGSAGSGNALTKSTTWLAVLFFITSLSLAVLARNQADAGVQVESLLANPDAVADVPVAPVAAETAAGGDTPTVDAAQAVGTDVAVDVPAETGAIPEDVTPAAGAAVETTVEPDTQTTEN